MTVKEYLSTLPKSVLVILAMSGYAHYNLEALQHKVKTIQRDIKLLKGVDYKNIQTMIDWSDVK